MLLILLYYVPKIKMSIRLEKLLSDLRKRCELVAGRCAYFSDTRLLRHGQIFPIKLTRAAIALSVGASVAALRFARIENETRSVFPEGRTILSEVIDALGLVNQFITVFAPVTRLQYFAEEEVLVKGWKEALEAVQSVKKKLVQTGCAASGDPNADVQTTTWDPLDDAGLVDDQNRLEVLFSAVREATTHVYGEVERNAQIAFDVDRQRNRKIKKLLDRVRGIAKADAKADTAISVESMLDATSVYDAFVRQYQLGTVLDKLGKKTKSLRGELGDTIKASWSQLGFDMDDDRAYEMIDTFFNSSKKNASENEDGESSGPSLDAEQRPRVFASAEYLGTLEQATEGGDVVVVSKQSKKPPSPLDYDLYPQEAFELPDFEGSTSRAAQWIRFKACLETKFRLVTMSVCWVWDGEQLLRVSDGKSLWAAMASCMPPPPAPIAKRGIVLESDSDGDSEADGDSDGDHDADSDGDADQKSGDSLIKWVREECMIFVCGPFAPLATLNAARDMPTSDDLRTAVVYMSTCAKNAHVSLAACRLLQFLITRGPRDILAARADFMWRSGMLETLLQTTKTFRRDVDHVELALRVFAAVLERCPKACADIGLAWDLVEIINFSHDYKAAVKRFGPIQALVCSIVCSLSAHGGRAVQVRLGGAAVDAVLGALRAPAPTEELVRCICQGLAALAQEPNNARLIFQPPTPPTPGVHAADAGGGHRGGGNAIRGKPTFKRGPSWFPRTICGLLRAREVRNDVEILYRLVHCCNSVLLCAAVAGKNEGEDIFAGVSLGELGEAIMQLMARWEHANLDTRCVQLLQTIGRVGDNEVRLALAVAGLPKLLSEEFRSAVDVLPSDGLSNLLNAIVSTTRGEIAQSECRILVQDGMIPALAVAMDRFPSAPQAQSACIRTLEHLCILPATRWSIFDAGIHVKIITAVANNAIDSTLVVSAARALVRIVAPALTFEEKTAEKEFMAAEHAAAVEIANAEAKLLEEKEQAAEAEAAVEAAAKASASFWEGDEAATAAEAATTRAEAVAEGKEKEKEKEKQAALRLHIEAPKSAPVRLLDADLVPQLLNSLQLQAKDSGVVIGVFDLLASVLHSAVTSDSTSSHLRGGDAATDEEVVTKLYLRSKVAEEVVRNMGKNAKNAKILGAAGHLLRRMCECSKRLYESTVLANAPAILLDALHVDLHCSSAGFLSGAASALAAFVHRDGENSTSRRKQLSTLMLNIIGPEGSGLSRIIEKCVEAHLASAAVLTATLGLILEVLLKTGKTVLETAPSLRGKLIDIVYRCLKAHPNVAEVAAVSIQVAATLVNDAKTGLQLFHAGVAALVMDAFDAHSSSSAGVVHGTCKLVYLLASSRTVRQMLKSTFKGIRNNISAGFAAHCATSRKVKKWGKDAMGKLALP